MRTTEDAVRSFKRYLALSLGQPTPRVAAAKWFPDPASFDPDGSFRTYSAPDFVAGDLWFDLSPGGTLDAAPLSSTDGLVTMGYFGSWSFWGNPPGKRFDSSSLSLVDVVAADRESVSMSLVRGCAEVPSPAWQEVLAGGRWGLPVPVLESGSGRPFRCLMLTDHPMNLTAAALDTMVFADELTDPAEWDVRFFHDQGDFEYPVCIVKTVGPPVVAGHALYMEVTQPFTLYAYPTPPDAARASYSDAQLRAHRTQQLLISALNGTRANGAAPMRLPLFDYDGLDAQMSSASRADHDYLKVVDAAVDVMPEPTDPLQSVVVADVRLNWRVTLEEGRGLKRVKAFDLSIVES